MNTPVSIGHPRDSATIAKKNRLHVEAVKIHAAAQFFEKFEHLGNCGLGVWHYAVSNEEVLLGMISFGTTCFAGGRGKISVTASNFGLPVYQIARGGTSGETPFNTPSRVLSEAIRGFHREQGDCLLIAYADRAFNEMGTIYQACNALYTGKTDPKGQSNYIIEGRWMSGWNVRKRFGTRAMQTLREIDKNAIRVPLTSKYRYAFVLAAPLRKRQILAAMAEIARPYPKRNIECIP